jgi:FkbM family methyltransferase
VVLLRKGTYDAAIWGSVGHDYPTLPRSFAPGQLVLDVGCHTGALCDLAARRGARVVGYEANRENHALAAVNLAGHPSVTLHLAAVWRSDLPRTQLLFTPNPDGANTGGGSVLFSSAQDHRRSRPDAGPAPGPPDVALSTHPVPAVGLDEVLADVGPVRFLKLDVEGAEFPILLTATRLHQVDAVGGEYHELTDAQMADLAPGARVGRDRYTVGLLRARLFAAGFEVTVEPDGDRGLFWADRR